MSDKYTNLNKESKTGLKSLKISPSNLKELVPALIEDIVSNAENLIKISYSVKIVVKVVKISSVSIWLLMGLVIMAFFDEQIFRFFNLRFESLSQNQVSTAIGLLALMFTAIQTIISYRALKKTRL
ncbi:MAG: hypothetical protein ABIC36_02385 [bacterium]